MAREERSSQKTDDPHDTCGCLFHDAFEEAGDAIILSRPEIGMLANRVALDLLGYTARELAVMSVETLVAPGDLSIRPLNLGGVRDGWTIANLRTLRRKDGSQIVVETNTRGLPDGGMVIVFRNVESRVHESVQLRLLQDAAVAANDATDLRSASAICLERVCETEGFVVGHLWAFDEESGTFESSCLWQPCESPSLEKFREKTLHATFARDDGSLPSRVITSGRPVGIRDVRHDPRFLRAEIARKAGLAGAVALPVLAHGAIVAVLEFFCSEPRDANPRLLTLLSDIGIILGRTAERERAHRELGRVQERLDLALRAARSGTWEVDLRGRATWDERLTELFDIEPGAAPGPPEVVHPEDRPRLEADLLRALEEGGEFSAEYRIQRGDGTVAWFQSQGHVQEDADGSRRVVGVSWDVTDRREVEARLRSLALFDPLTRLPNRHALEERLAEAQAAAEQRGERLAVLLIDLDGFGQVNESLGRKAGDELLCAVVDRLVAATADSDRILRVAGPAERAGIARVGGDEFALILSGLADPTHAARLAVSILDAMVPSFQLHQGEVYSNASIGIAIAPDDGPDPETLLQNADAALRAEKREGRGNYRFYDTSLNAAALRRLEMEAAVRRALRDDSFHLLYQPLIDARSGDIVGAEALVRLPRSETGESFSPAEFIPLAESAGLIPLVGDWVLRETMRQGAAWHAAGRDLDLSVNLSSLQLRTRGIAERVRQILAETGFPPERLILEITETAILEDEAVALETIRELRAQGVQLALDDFGTGYSSLTRLHRLPFDRLKLDRAFVRDVSCDAKVAVLTQTVLALTKSLGLVSVGEGVETDDHADFLVEHGCDELQGHLFSPPVPPETFERLHDHGIERKAE